MRNRTNWRPSVVVTTNDLTGTSSSALSSNDSDYLSHTSYYGPRPKPLNTHNFSYEIIRFNSHLFKRQTSIRNVDQKVVAMETKSGPNGSRTLPFALSFSGVDKYSVEAEALERFNERTRGSLDLATSAAEWRSTRDMLHYKSQTDFFDKVQQKLFRKVNTAIDLYTFVKRSAKTAADIRLQYMYGWKPLASDIYGIAKQAANVAASTFERYSAQAEMTFEGVTASFLNYNATRAETQFPGKRFTVKDRFGVILEAGDPTSIERFSGLNPVSLAWELTPLSFVSDWVFDVGSYLRGVETSLLYGNRFVSGYKSNLQLSEGSLSFNKFSLVKGSPNSVLTEHKNSGSYYYRKFSRQKLFAYPTPRVPSFKVDLGSSQLLTGAALLAQLLK